MISSGLTISCSEQTDGPETPSPGAGPAMEDPGAYMAVVDGGPVHWPPCMTITWALNPGPSSLDVRQQIVDGGTVVLDASGLRSEFAGFTDVVSSGEADHGYDILIQVVAPHVTELLPMGDWGHTSMIRDGVHWTAATVSLSVDGVGVLDQPDAPFSWTALTMHEVGHALGLAHSSDTASLMYPDLSIAASTLSAGDLDALARMSDDAECSE